MCARSHRPAHRGGLILFLIGLLAACVQPESVREMEVVADPFARALHREYLAVADERSAEGKPFVASFYAFKAKAAAEGRPVFPERMRDWDLAPATGERLGVLRARLVTTVAEIQNPEYGRTYVDDAAEAQVLFDCWIAAEEAGTDPSDCGGRFENALASLEAVVDQP